MTEWTDEMWAFLAMMLGFNELAKTQDTLGRKLFCRLGCQQAEKSLRALGADISVERKPAVVTLPRPPHVEFTEDDIELMRAAVAEHDRRKEEPHG